MFPLKSIVSRWNWVSLFEAAVKHYLKCWIYPQPIFQMYSNYGLLFLPVIKNYNPCLLSFFPFGLCLSPFCFSFLPCMSCTLFFLHLPLIWSGKINNLQLVAINIKFWKIDLAATCTSKLEYNKKCQLWLHSPLSSKEHLYLHNTG